MFTKNINGKQKFLTTFTINIDGKLRITTTLITHIMVNLAQ